ncbi:MAG: hypothetical protein ABFD89_17510 [Bryobacteraceae bacterium]
MSEAAELGERIKRMDPASRLRLAAGLIEEARKQEIPKALSTLKIARSIAESVQLEIGAALLSAQFQRMRSRP